MTDFNRDPDSYQHWRLGVDGKTATLELAVQPDKPYRDGYELKLNSYDLGVDIELADALQRIRFEHPEVTTLVFKSGIDRIFSAGANIRMLAASSHPFKVNFCKYTNETRLGLEDLATHSGVHTIAALNGLAAGGGYELAISCERIYLVDDGNSAVSLPEVPLLGVLPGTGGLTRLVDKRKVRRDHADIFCTVAEGVRGPKAKEWNLIDDTFPRSRFDERVGEIVKGLNDETPARGDRGIKLHAIEPEVSEDKIAYRHVTVDLEPEKRTATITVHGPAGAQPKDGAGYLEAGDDAWALRAFRELDDAICRLRFDHENIGLWLLKTRGDMDAILEVEKTLAENQDHWLVREITLFIARTIRRWDLSARSLFALVDQQSACAGVFFELALGSDRIYMYDSSFDDDLDVQMAIGPLSGGLLPMSHGMTRLENRFLRDRDRAARLAAEQPRMSGKDAYEQGLVTVLADDIDWDDEVRIAIEERVSLSPDALTGMEASLRFGGAENCDSKIFGRLSAWQNWIFTRPNATGEEGALVRYGQPEAATFDWRRT
ncbi:MAG: benzoyl-CoA-dihydrodiol lyase [Planctomycetes bacterium]|nr:benzoyl-CoA-dihydrodiol lyase [Planctomycetota bacterium]MCB9892590.1 benzoyl-CoA-dihydrodiol lyase [Planctomycetota bacterium]MCB9917861.1 benzoyl-CoA-dihydrodiol lyase [Planctomycetota bacterium]